MKSISKRRIVFVAKSMLWSILLYVVLMLAFNWDDVSGKVRGSNPITITTNTPVEQLPATNDPAVIPANISHHIGILEKSIVIAKSISCIIGIATR